jgi:4-amino-4-deoxy-L-arabinose transferase-like glycosyltransferase
MKTLISESDNRPTTSRADLQLLLSITVLGALLRFWGLGGIGLHGDEDTMGLAVKGILESGSPTLPSGMLYVRGLVQTYLMAASAEMFGLTEWALRLPSVLTGTVTIVVSYFLGRRFLSPKLSLLFALIIALFPAFISISQTARMYVFYVTFVMVFAVAVFRWERTQSLFDFGLAFLALLVALHFHRLSIFSVFLFFWPGVVQGSVRNVMLGALGAVSTIGIFQLQSRWIQSKYTPAIEFSANEPESSAITAGYWWFNEIASNNIGMAILLVALVVITLLVAIRRIWTQPKTHDELISTSSWAAGLLFAVALQYHVALILLALGAVFYFRGGGRWPWAFGLGAVIFILALLQIAIIWKSGSAEDYKDVVMTMLGSPNPWPYLRFAGFFPIAIILYVGIFAYFTVLFLRRGRVPDHVIWVLISVWLPLFLIGYFRGHIPLRYAVGFTPFFILAFLAGMNSLRAEVKKLKSPSVRGQVGLTAVALLIIINPTDLWYNVDPQYSDFRHLSGHRGADHKGAAEFIKSLNLTPSDIVVAEDVLQQVYYLGSVDYWLRKFAKFTYREDGAYVDIYTGTKHLGNAELVQDLIDQYDRGDIYIIGSGETADEANYYLGEKTVALLSNTKSEVLYEGRDKQTRVLRIPVQK